jgi:predicted HicB family RNase H-like nuclease
MFFVDTIKAMKKPKRGRPPKEVDKLRSESLLVRLEGSEKEAFKSAADLAGVPLSTWVRERLRQIASRELGKASRPVAFLRQAN